MALLPFTAARKRAAAIGAAQGLPMGSIEMMPRTASKIDDFRAILPQRMRVYVAHIDGTPIDDMVATAARIAGQGFNVMPHFPARSIPDLETLQDWIARYQGEAGIHEALILAGGIAQPRGDFHSAMQLLDTGAFDRAGFTRLHVAGHPEGNRDIDPDGGSAQVDEALAWKQGFANQTDAQMAIVTQFAFDADPVLDWARRIAALGVTMPVHIGIAGPAKLQTLIKYALACGVGPSLKVLQKRAMDVTALLRPYEPTELIARIAQAHREGQAGHIEQLHIFPLGGIGASATYAAGQGSSRSASA